MKESQEKKLRQYVRLLLEVGYADVMTGPGNGGGTGRPAGTIDQYTEIMGYPLHAWKEVIRGRPDREFVIAGKSLNQGGPDRHEKEARAEWDSCDRCDLLWSQMSNIIRKWPPGDSRLGKRQDHLDQGERGGPYEELLRRSHVSEFDKEWDRFWASEGTQLAVEILDPTGVTSWQYVKPAWDDYEAAHLRAQTELRTNGVTIAYAGYTGETWLNQILIILALLSVIPVLGKAGKLGKLGKIPEWLQFKRIQRWLGDRKFVKKLKGYLPAKLKKDLDFLEDFVDDAAEGRPRPGGDWKNY